MPRQPRSRASAASAARPPRRPPAGRAHAAARRPPAEAMVGGAADARDGRAGGRGGRGARNGGPAPVINFGPMSLVNGKIDFTDLFVKPNYSADLSELDRQAQRLLVEAAGRQAGAGRPRTARQGAADRVARDHRQAQSAGQAARTRHHGQDARARPAAAVAVFGALRRPWHRARQAQHGRQLQDRARRPADRDQQAGAQPAAVRRAGRGRARQPAGAAGRGAAGRPQRRDRHRPAAQRLDQRPAVQHRPADLQGDRQPDRQGRHGAVRAADRRPWRRQRRVERDRLRARQRRHSRRRPRKAWTRSRRR